MRRISNICREQARHAGHAARERARRLRHEFRHRRPHRLRHRLLILGGTLAAVVGLWFFVQGRAAHILQREFGRAMGDGWTLSVGRMGMNPLHGSYSARDICISFGEDSAKAKRHDVTFGVDGASATKKPVETVDVNRKPVRPARKPLDLSLDGVVAEGLSLGDKSLTINCLSLIKPRIARGAELRVHVGWMAVNRDSIVSLNFAVGRLSIKRVSHLSNDQSVRMSLDELLVDTAARTVSVARAAIEPTYPKTEFTKKSWSHSDWTQVLLHNIFMGGIDFGQLLGAGTRAQTVAGEPLSIDSVHVGGGSVSSFKDRNVARDETEKPMYHTLLQRITPYAKVRVLVFDAIDVIYEELASRGTIPGRVEFGEISGEAVLHNANATPGDAATSVPHYFWQLRALVQGTATLTANGTIPLVGDVFTMQGTLGHCDAAIFNPIALPLGGIKVVGGALGGLHFFLTGNSQMARARVGMAYQGLEVAVFSRHNRERRLLTTIANDIMLEHTISWREAAAEQARNPLRSPWNYIWHSIFAAAKDPIGMKPSTEVNPINTKK